jgi:aspartyl-tRNA(Asn)/glutamyl-tRNA(Gln) amidotransferase subunit C
MTIDSDTVRHMAALAELAIADDDIPALAAQLESIVQFVAQLHELPPAPADDAVTIGPERLTLRPDRVDPIPLSYPVADMAPEFEQGFFVVPRLGALGDA